MSFARLLADGAQEAVTLIPLLFALGVAPAHAQLPRTAVAQAVAQAVAPATVPASQATLAASANAPGVASSADTTPVATKASATDFDAARLTTKADPSLLTPVTGIPMLTPSAGTPMPTLIAQHVVIELADGEARLRTTSVFRNDTDAPISARYVLPLTSAVTLRGVDDEEGSTEPSTDETLAAGDHGCGGDAPDDLQSADAEEFIEAGEPDPRGQQTGVLWLEPGDEITLVATRPADVFRRDARRRVVIALPPAPAGQPAPQFSAEIDVDAPQPIVALGSATHGGEVDGLGGSRARLFIPNGKVYEARFLSVDLELGTVQQETGRRWGNEDRLPIAAR